jgi:uncharacterized coiled-coil DUF342 family protein|tara:strand:+ start:3301 stop:3546 length:246 start_codon:yes stop_codon:yes gene_type:complete
MADTKKKLLFSETPRGKRILKLASKIEALRKEMEKESSAADELRRRITPHLRKWAELKAKKNELKEELEKEGAGEHAVSFE